MRALQCKLDVKPLLNVKAISKGTKKVYICMFF